MADLGDRRVVLVAEDEVMLRNLIRETLESAGFEVLSAADGREALALSEAFEGQIHALLADFNMPHLDGSRLIEAVQQRRPETAPILMTGGHMAGEFKDLHAAFLMKPFALKDLVDAVERALAPRKPDSLTERH